VLDPPAAARVHPRDTVRVERALEVVFSSGRRLSDWQAAHRFAESSYDALLVGLAVALPDLEERIATRARRMVTAGFADEVRRLRASGLADTAPAWASVGYREMRAHVDGACDLEAAVGSLVVSTRRFAKRQRTWFRAEPGVLWRDPVRDRERVLAEAMTFLARGERPAA
jgi:tRNA dimethylallyltransferase